MMFLHAECHRQVTKLGELNSETLKKLGVRVTFDEKKKQWKINKKS